MNMICNMKEHPSYTRLREIMADRRIDLSDADLARKLNVSDQVVNNWTRRGIPKDVLIDLSDEWNFKIKYVRDGVGSKFHSDIPYGNSPEAMVQLAMQKMKEDTKHRLVKISDTLAEPEPGNGTHKD